MMSDRCQRLVVVLGPADPALQDTLIYVGLHVVHAVGDLTVWAPIDWQWESPAAADNPELWAALERSHLLTWAAANYPCDI